MKRINFGGIECGAESLKNLISCWTSTWVSGGKLVKKFEDKWSKMFGYAASVAMSSGTDADIQACIALYDFGAKRGDEIIVPACAFIATANSILAAGFKPVFVDIEIETLNINPDLIEAAITDKTVAIMAVHTMGKPCDMVKIMGIAKAHNLKVIEDCCEAHGAEIKDEFIGKFGDFATFSFYQAHLVNCAEGGMVSVNNPEYADILRSTRCHGRIMDGTNYFDFPRYGLNSKMNDLEASFGLEGLEKFQNTFTFRQMNYYDLIEEFSTLKDKFFISEQDEEVTNSPHAFSITIKDPNKYNFKVFHDYMMENGIEVKRNFGSTPTQHKSFEWMGHKLGDFPEAEYVGSHGLHFGIHQGLSMKDVEYISKTVKEFFV